MSRSVSTPTHAEAIAYQDVNDYDFDTFKWWLEEIADHARSMWPSFDPCDTWLDREDHAILENGLCYFGVSEYGGVAAIWLVPKEYRRFETQYVAPLALNFIAQIAPRFHRAFGQYRKIGTFSNGEAIYRAVDPPQTP